MPSAVAPGAPVVLPAKVSMRMPTPAASEMTRTRCLAGSETYSAVAVGSSASPHGEKSSAALGGPPSPVVPFVLHVPASTVTRPVDVLTTRMTCAAVSAMKRERDAASKATPAGARKPLKDTCTPLPEHDSALLFEMSDVMMLVAETRETRVWLAGGFPLTTFVVK
jgi:hypothetical protein